MKKKKILIVGPIFNSPAGPMGQGGKLFHKLKEESEYTVNKVSHIRNKYIRFIHIILNLINPRRYDVVLLQLFAQNAFLMEDVVTRICKLFDKKCIVTIRGGAFIEFYDKNQNWCNNVLKRASEISTPSLYIQKELADKGFTVTYIPNHIETELFPYSWKDPAEYKILWVRAFHQIYNPEKAVRCIAYLKEKIPNVKLTMVGPDQGELENVQKLIDSLLVREFIDIVGPIPNNQLLQLYQSHKVFITTTNYESFGVAIAEAACTGIPMVSTNAGEIPYLWENNKEMLISTLNNQNEFNLKVEQLLLDSKLRSSLSNEARKKAIKFNWQNVRTSWIKLINK